MRVERHVGLGDEDRPALLDFWVRAWAPVVPTIDFAARRSWLSDHLDTLVAEGAVLLLIRGEAGQPLAFLTLNAQTGEIDQLATDPDVAGRGLARALMDEAKRLSPGGLLLRVNVGNERARHVYERAGFGIVGEAISESSGLPVLMMAWPAPP